MSKTSLPQRRRGSVTFCLSTAATLLALADGLVAQHFAVFSSVALLARGKNDLRAVVGDEVLRVAVAVGRAQLRSALHGAKVAHAVAGQDRDALGIALEDRNQQ
jgi:hypothetical protein